MYESLVDHFAFKPPKGKPRFWHGQNAHWASSSADKDIESALPPQPSPANHHLPFVDTDAGNGPGSTSSPISTDDDNMDAKARSTFAQMPLDEDEEAQATLWKPSKSEYMVMITMAVSSLMVALDATILVPALPVLATDLNGTAAEAFWTGTAYLLTHSVLQPCISTLSDIFGRRELLVPSISCFAIGSVLCGISKNFTIMLLGRVIQGIGGAGIITLSQTIFADLVPLRQRPKYFAMVLGAWAVGSVAGPLVGGVFVQKVSWRWW